MKTLITLLIAAALACFGPGCGGDGCKISGSQCELMDCGYDTLTCHKYAAPNDALKIFYERNFDEGTEWTAIMVIDLIGLDQVDGLVLEGEDCTDRVTIYNILDQWPDYDDCTLEIKKGGPEVGKQLRGKASFRFNNGYFSTNCFPRV